MSFKSIDLKEKQLLQKKVNWILEPLVAYVNGACILE